MKLSLAIALAMIACAGRADAASRYDPALRFRVLATPHFYIYFHGGEDAIARRMAAIAEEVHSELTGRLQTTTAGRTHLILVDQNDLPNGWATPLPYNTIEITVAPPARHDVIGNADDWLRLVFAHEYTHILHLDRSRGFAEVARHVFGRAPIAFPNLFLPPWQTEGLATYEESALTGRGRVNAGDFRVIVTQAARRGRLALDRASSDFDDWPSGNTPYAYGGFFHRYLADRYGDEKLGELARRTAGRFYFLSSPAFKSTFGKSLGDLWKEFRQSEASRQPADGVQPSSRRLTRNGFVVTGPRFVDRADGSREVVYSSRTSHDFPSLMAVTLDGRLRRVASRYYGDHADISGRAVIFDQQDLAKSVAIRSDLYVFDMAGGGTRRITGGARFLDPAVSPDGSRLACVALRNGERRLFVFDLPAGAWPRDVGKLQAALRAAPHLALDEPGVEYSSPRWSPDGRTLAVARAGRDGASEIALVDGSTGRATVLVSSTRERNVTPAWMPDGRTVLFASDLGGGPFNVYAVDVPEDGRQAGHDAAWQVTREATGASFPDVSSDGRQLAYAGYTDDGYDVFVAPLDRSAWSRASSSTGTPAPSRRVESNAQVAETPADRAAPPPARTYRPWRTLLPRFWIPSFEVSDQQVKLGAATAGTDVLGRHLYSATLLYRVAGESGAPGSPRADWIVSYVYDRWRPAFFASASDRTHFLQKVATQDGATLQADIRERNEELGIFVPDTHVRYSQAVTASLTLQRQVLNIGGLARRDSERNAVRLAWAFSSAKTYGYSISPEQGVRLGITGEFVRKALGAAGSADAATLDGRAYVRLGSRHSILAVRAGAGFASGDPGTRRLFFLGGSGPNESPADFSSDALNLLRGFALNEFVGSRIAVVNAEYRVPLLRIERGAGTWPLFLRTVHAAGFFDAGKTWDENFSRMPFARSFGAEVAANVRVGYELPLTASFGVAWPRVPFGASPGPTAYFRLGHAF